MRCSIWPPPSLSARAEPAAAGVRGSHVHHLAGRLTRSCVFCQSSKKLDSSRKNGKYVPHSSAGECSSFLKQGWCVFAYEDGCLGGVAGDATALGGYDPTTKTEAVNPTHHGSAASPHFTVSHVVHDDESAGGEKRKEGNHSDDIWLDPAVVQSNFLSFCNVNGINLWSRFNDNAAMQHL